MGLISLARSGEAGFDQIVCLGTEAKDEDSKEEEKNPEHECGDIKGSQGSSPVQVEE